MKKIPTIFVRDFAHDNGRYVIDQVTPGCEWVLSGEGIATRKWDGTCVLVKDDKFNTIWTRREVKVGKVIPKGFDLIEHDLVTGKSVGWEPAEQSGFAKYIHEVVVSRGSFAPGTYELVGPKINGNPDKLNEHMLVPHGQDIIEMPTLQRTYTGLQAVFQIMPWMEGLVFWRKQNDPDAGMAKIKARDFKTT
jgi:hypothetical protein